MSPYLKIGDWDVHANGIHGTLRVRRIDELGRVSGDIFGQPITGWWSERARRLIFNHHNEETDPSETGPTQPISTSRGWPSLPISHRCRTWERKADQMFEWAWYVRSCLWQTS